MKNVATTLGHMRTEVGESGEYFRDSGILGDPARGLCGLAECGWGVVHCWSEGKFSNLKNCEMIVRTRFENVLVSFYSQKFCASLIFK